MRGTTSCRQVVVCNSCNVWRYDRKQFVSGTIYLGVISCFVIVCCLCLFISELCLSTSSFNLFFSVLKRDNSFVTSVSPGKLTKNK